MGYRVGTYHVPGKTIILIAMKDSAFKNLLVNLRALFTTNIRRRINENTNKIAMLEEFVVDQKITERYYFLKVLDYYVRHEQEAAAFQKELDYLRQKGTYCIFPYPTESISTIQSGFDTAAGLPYVVHNQKKLYFPASFSEEAIVETYSNYIQTEKILAIGDTSEAPHQYQSSTVHVEKGDVIFDIGAAEGLFALDQVDNASRVIIVENDPQWTEPLHHTFAPWQEKTMVIQKGVSVIDTDYNLSLKTLLSETADHPTFIKMDIEGYELPVITSALDFLKGKENIKMAAAVYHRQHDAEEIKALFDSIGYTSEFSKGYMLFHLYDMPTPPYFRRGIIRAKK